MNAQVNALIDSWKEEYAAMLTRWIQVPSEKSAPAENAPFGTEVKKMLDLAIADIEAMGFPTRNIDNYACDATLGDENKEMIAVLGHLDVVPAGDGWRVPPFAAVREGDNIVGRGTSDDKGPALAALFAMRAIKEAGIPLKRSVRLILGCDEESGWEDMAYYAAHAEMPAMGFSPDASFPLINTEKGALKFYLNAPVPATGLQVKKLWTGERLNVIPGESVAVVAGGQEIIDKVQAYAAKTGLDYKAELVSDGVQITATGIAGHAAYPEGRRNAIGMMLLVLKELGAEGVYATFADKIGMEYDGKSLGIAYSDDVSGSLTLNTGILHLEENGTLTMTLDCRVPITADLEAMRGTVAANLPGVIITKSGKTAPHHVPADSELVSSLLGAYTAVTGLEGTPEYTGGGTYAKVLQQGVAFGASFPGDPDLAHQANEYIELDKMMLAAKVYAESLLRLCAE